MAIIKRMPLVLMVAIVPTLAAEFTPGPEFGDRSFVDTTGRSTTVLKHTVKARVASKKGPAKASDMAAKLLADDQKTVVIGSTICMPGACSNARITSWAELK